MPHAPSPKSESWFDRWALRAISAGLVLLVVAQNVAVARVWVCQIRSASFPTTEGVVLAYKQVVTPSRRSTKLEVEYAYEVNGVRWVSERYWYESFVTKAFPTDPEVAARFPVGSRVAVSYDPADPADAVLIPGLQGVDVLAVWLLVLLDGGVLLFARGGRGRDEADYSARRQLNTRFGWRLALFSEPVGWSFGGVLMIALPFAFVIAIGTLGPFPSFWGTVKLTAAACVLAGAWVWLLRSKVWLAVDAAKRELRWHSGAWYDGTFVLPFAAVTDVRTAEAEYVVGKPVYRVEIDWHTTKHRTRTVYLPTGDDRAAVEAAAARLREAVFGATPAP